MEFFHNNFLLQRMHLYICIIKNMKKIQNQYWWWQNHFLSGKRSFAVA